MAGGIKISISGMDALVKDLHSYSDSGDVERIVRKHGAQLQSRTMENMDATYTRGYSTGRTKNSTALNITNSGLTAEVAPGTDYFPFLELGTREMSARPTLGPAFDVQSQMFIDELRNVFGK